MQPLGLNEIRELYLKFFESKQHLRMPSFSLIPQNDKSLLLINAGMAPLKPYFTGQEIPPSKRVATCQKCIRTGDIDNVGKTARHGTFFEMLGNFSFGDYFKEEAIAWAWEFVTEWLEIPSDKLYISIYQDDDEAFDIWNKNIGIPAERIFRLGKEDNFWELGLGPCGPCSEIYYDRGPEYGCGKEDCAVGCDCDRYLEFWNLVFTQFNKKEDGSYSDLEHPNIDTGMGLERVAAMMQNVYSLFDVDTIKAIRDKVCELSKIEYTKDKQKDISIRIITDHIRSITFMTADGVLPSNEGRGYVLRRLLRRAARHGKLLGINELFMSNLSQTVIDVSKGAYPELEDKQEYIHKVISVEEKRFYETIDQGISLLKNHIKEFRSTLRNILSGSEAFKLYDTFGFPLELMQEILSEEGMTVDEKAFWAEMEHQRERARQAREETNYSGADDTVYNHLDPTLTTEFVGYAQHEIDNAVITAIIADGEIEQAAKEGSQVSLVLDKSPFYAESGGQKGDSGEIVTAEGRVAVIDCFKAGGNKWIHKGKVMEGQIKISETAAAKIDNGQRMDTARNHTATHLLQKALREVLGNHVEQSGSDVSCDRLRFDFTHFAPLTEEELLKVENMVNDHILEGIPVKTNEMDLEAARTKGATALFGEKYGSIVRVVDIGGYSVELCGGTHVGNTGQIGQFKIISESGIAAGVRRIEAVTGHGALEYYRALEGRLRDIGSLIKASPENLISKIKNFIFESKQLSSEMEKLKAKLTSGQIDSLLDERGNIGGVDVICTQIPPLSVQDLRAMGDRIKDRLECGVIILSSPFEDNLNLLVMATDKAVQKGVHAGNIVKEAAASLGGKGGGRPNMAQAGIKNPEKAQELLIKAQEVLFGQIK